MIDGHFILFTRPKCKDCEGRLLIGTITVSKRNCWKCRQKVRAATSETDGQGLEQDVYIRKIFKS